MAAKTPRSDRTTVKTGVSSSSTLSSFTPPHVVTRMMAII